MSTTQTTEKLEILNPQRWGLPNSAVEKLGEELRKIWERFRPCFKTQTRDGSEYAWFYLRGLLTMETERNYANIARRVIDPSDDGQNLQQFMSSRFATIQNYQLSIQHLDWVSRGNLGTPLGQNYYLLL